MSFVQCALKLQGNQASSDEEHASVGVSFGDELCAEKLEMDRYRTARGTIEGMIGMEGSIAFALPRGLG
jgi:hypothetical protein